MDSKAAGKWFSQIKDLQNAGTVQNQNTSRIRINSQSDIELNRFPTETDEISRIRGWKKRTTTCRKNETDMSMKEVP